MFNNASGQTHVLDPMAALLLGQIEEGYGDSEKLFGQIARLLDFNLTQELRDTLNPRLQQLDELGLIECSYRETGAA